MTRKNKIKSKKKTNFFNKNSVILSIIVSLIPIFINLVMYYKDRIDSTYFLISYSAIKLENINSDEAYYKEIASYPTLNTDISKILNDTTLSLDGYYVIYLILNQYGEVPNKELNIKFNKYDHDNNNLLINYNNKKLVSKSIHYQLKNKESIKIPISICKVSKDDYSIYDCIITKYEPISISYNNRYIFSNTTKEVRKLYNLNLFIDGENLGMGREEFENIKWYLRK